MARSALISFCLLFSTIIGQSVKLFQGRGQPNRALQTYPVRRSAPSGFRSFLANLPTEHECAEKRSRAEPIARTALNDQKRPLNQRSNLRLTVAFQRDITWMSLFAGLMTSATSSSTRSVNCPAKSAGKGSMGKYFVNSACVLAREE